MGAGPRLRHRKISPPMLASGSIPVAMSAPTTSAATRAASAVCAAAFTYRRIARAAIVHRRLGAEAATHQMVPFTSSEALFLPGRACRRHGCAPCQPDFAG